MYNPQLDTFIRVADAGSFNKAAEESYITPTAVIKQINLLEDSLGIKLIVKSSTIRQKFVETHIPFLEKWLFDEFWLLNPIF